MSSEIRILFIGVNPDDTEPLGLPREVQKIQAKLDVLESRTRLRLEQRWNPTPAELPGLLMRYEPHVVHFSGHGDADGKLHFEHAAGHSQLVDATSMQRLFELHEGVRCVVLNACYSAKQAQMIAEHVDVVIGMRSEIGDADAALFAAGFYEGLGYGKNIALAVKLGCLQVSLADSAGRFEPEIHVRGGLDASKVVLLEPTPVRGPVEVDDIAASLPDPSATGVEPQDIADAATALGDEAADVEAFLAQLFSDSPSDWQAALEPYAKALWPDKLPSKTFGAVVRRSRIHTRTTSTWLAWLDVLAKHLVASGFAPLCRAINLLRDADDPALVLSRLCRIANPPHAAVGGWMRSDIDRGSVVQLVLRDLLPPQSDGVAVRERLATADFVGAYLVGLDARGVGLPSHAAAWAGADLRHADFEVHIDTLAALCEVGSVQALDVPVARGGGIRAIRLDSGLIVSAHEDESLRVWSADGPLLGTLWPGVRCQQLAAWGEAIVCFGLDRLVRMSTAGERSEIERDGSLFSGRSIAALPDGRLAVTADDGWIELVSPDSLEVVDRFRTGRARVSSLCVVGEGRHAALIWGAYDGSIGVRPLGGGPEVLMRGEDGARIGMLGALGPDRLAAATVKGLVRVWSTAGEELACFDAQAEVTEMVAIADGFAFSDSAARIRVWHSAGGVEDLAKVHRCAWGLLALEPRRLWCVAEHRMQEWTLAGELRREVRDIPPIFRAAISEEAIVWSEGELPHLGGEVRVWHLSSKPDGTPTLRSTTELHSPKILRLDGRRVLGASAHDSCWHAWDGRSYAVEAAFLGFEHGDVADIVAFRGGVAIGTDKGELMFQRVTRDDDDLDEYQRLDVVDADRSDRAEIRALAVSPAGQRLAAARADATIEVVSADRRVELVTSHEARALCWLDEDTLALTHADGPALRRRG